MQTKTITIQIGNTDNKLTQKEWSDFCTRIADQVDIWSEKIHFAAPSIGWDGWQNAIWVFECKIMHLKDLKSEVAKIRKEYKQDSVAWLQGTTKFI